MMRDSWKREWTLISITLVCGCQLSPEQLEVGEHSDDAETGGDGDILPADECWAQGTHRDGSPDPVPTLECEVECASGWGHDVGLLPIAWTLDVAYDDQQLSFTYFERLPSGQLLLLIGRYDGPPRLMFISPEGEIDDDFEQPELTGDIKEVVIDGSGTVFAVGLVQGAQWLTAMSSTGEILWSVELGPQESYEFPLAAREDGVVVVLNPADEFGIGELWVAQPAGPPMQLMGPIPFTSQIAVSPSGNTIALANNTSITWLDLESFPAGTSVQGVADVLSANGLVALDDERVIGIGTSENWDEEGSQHAYVHEIGPMGLAWGASYDRATAWCGDVESATLEGFSDVARLADGSLLIAGIEMSRQDYYQPWVGHVSAEGDMLAMDRGFWDGTTSRVVAADDGSGYALLHDFEQPRLHVRKYLP